MNESQSYQQFRDALAALSAGKLEEFLFGSGRFETNGHICHFHFQRQQSLESKSSLSIWFQNQSTQDTEKLPPDLKLFWDGAGWSGELANLSGEELARYCLSQLWLK